MHAAQNYIYIVFAILYIIYSIIKAGKKVTKNRPTVETKPEQSPTVNPPTASPIPKPEDDLTKMLEQVFGKKAEEKIPEKQIIKPKAQPVPIKTSMLAQQKEKISSAQKKLSSALHHTISKDVPIVPQTQTSKKVFAEAEAEEESGIDFDIRKAVIFSEILKRPEY